MHQVDIAPSHQALSDSDPLKGVNIAQHVKAWPSEATPISDSAVSFGGKSRTPSSPTATFVPVGHISLDAEQGDFTASEAYKIATFYVSTALRGSGLGRAAMDAVESMATSEPLSAKTLLLDTSSKENPGMAEKWEALGRDPPAVC